MATGPVALSKINVKPPQKLLDLALEYALKDPLKNALIISNLSQLKNDCSLAVRHTYDGRYAAASYYMDMPFYSIALMVDNIVEAKDLMFELADRHPELNEQPVYGLYDEATADIVEQCFTVIGKTREVKMVLQDKDIPELAYDESVYKIQRLTLDDVIRISYLYALTPTVAWTPKALEFGPYYGAFQDDHLVSIAGVHFATKWVGEVGNIVTHFKHRRQNLAYLSTRAVIEKLKNISDKIFLCVLADNEPAIKLYEKMGFVKTEDLYLLQYYL